MRFWIESQRRPQIPAPRIFATLRQDTYDCARLIIDHHGPADHILIARKLPLPQPVTEYGYARSSVAIFFSYEFAAQCRLYAQCLKKVGSHIQSNYSLRFTTARQDETFILIGCDLCEIPTLLAPITEARK